MQKSFAYDCRFFLWLALVLEIVYSEGHNVVDPYQAIVDSGCPKSVAGKKWMDSFAESMDENIKFKRRKENQRFKFGPSEVYKSEMSYEIPVKIGHLEESMEISVVDADIPLLLGLDYQRKWGIVIDISNNEMWFITNSGW